MLTVFRLIVVISRLQRFKTHMLSPGALPQASTFRAFGAGKLSFDNVSTPRAHICRSAGCMPHSAQSAMKTFVSPRVFALRLDANTSFLPSGENIGKPSKVSLYVMRSSPDPSTLIL